MQNRASHLHGYKGTGGFGGRGCDACSSLTESLRPLLPRCDRVREEPGPGGWQGARESLSDSAGRRSYEKVGSRTPKLDALVEDPLSRRLTCSMYSMYSMFSGDGNKQSISPAVQPCGETCSADARTAGEGERDRFRFKVRLSTTCTFGGRSIFPFSKLNLYGSPELAFILSAMSLRLRTSSSNRG